MKYLNLIAEKIPLLGWMFTENKDPLVKFMKKLIAIQKKEKGKDIDLDFLDHVKIKDDKVEDIYVRFLLVNSHHRSSAYVNYVKNTKSKNADILYIFSRGKSNNLIAKKAAKKIIAQGFFSELIEYPKPASKDQTQVTSKEKCFSLKKTD